MPGRFLAARSFYALSLLLGVTLLTFSLMVWFGPDQTYELIGRNSTPEQIAELRAELGYDRPFWSRYGHWLMELASGNLGLSNRSGESVSALLQRALPVTAALVLPGFLLGNLLGLAAGLWAAWRRDSLWDRLILGASVTGLSLSFLVIIIALQLLLCTPYGLNWFPARGWRMDSLSTYLLHVTVPTLALLLVTLGYNTRFYRAVAAEELQRDHVRTALAYGATPLGLLGGPVLRNCLVPVITRVLYSIPLVLVSGSLLLETYFGIPGIGRVTFDAISSGDQPVLLAIVTLTAALFVVVQLLAEFACRLADPRGRLP